MVSDADMIVRLVIAAVLSGMIGFERERHGRSAGLRTHILVGMGAALIMLTSMHICDIYKGTANADPGRIAAQVVTGVGFLGAGTILRFRASVRGLTTAASLWVVAAIGLAVGSGIFIAAICSTLLVLIILFLFSKIERIMLRRDWYKTLLIETKGTVEDMQAVRDALAKHHAEIKDFEIEKMEGRPTALVKMDLRLLTNRDIDKIIIDVNALSGVVKASWK